MMFAGVFGFLTRRSTLAEGYEGYFFSLFSIAISAAESAIAIAIMINIYRMKKHIQADGLEEMKW